MLSVYVNSEGCPPLQLGSYGSFFLESLCKLIKSMVIKIRWNTNKSMMRQSFMHAPAKCVDKLILRCRWNRANEFKILFRVHRWDLFLYCGILRVLILRTTNVPLLPHNVDTEYFRLRRKRWRGLWKLAVLFWLYPPYYLTKLCEWQVSSCTGAFSNSAVVRQSRCISWFWTFC